MGLDQSNLPENPRGRTTARQPTRQVSSHADSQAGSPEPVELPARLEALVVALEAALRFARDVRCHVETLPRMVKICDRHIDGLEKRIATIRSGSATGGNEKLTDAP